MYICLCYTVKTAVNFFTPFYGLGPSGYA